MIERIAVIGGSEAGVEIAALAALGGYATCLCEADPAGLIDAGRRLQARLAALSREGESLRGRPSWPSSGSNSSRRWRRRWRMQTS